MHSAEMDGMVWHVAEYSVKSVHDNVQCNIREAIGPCNNSISLIMLQLQPLVRSVKCVNSLLASHFLQIKKIFMNLCSFNAFADWVVAESDVGL